MSKNLEGVQLGDPVWQRSKDRWGKVTSLCMSEPFSLEVFFGGEESKTGIVVRFSPDGTPSGFSTPDLFFDKIQETEYPKRPIMLDERPVREGDRVYSKDDGLLYYVETIRENSLWLSCAEGGLRRQSLIENFTRTFTRIKPIVLEGTPLKIDDVVYRKSNNHACVVKYIDEIRVELQDFTGGTYCGSGVIEDLYTRKRLKQKVSGVLKGWVGLYRGVGGVSIAPPYNLVESKEFLCNGVIPAKATIEYEAEL